MDTTPAEFVTLPIEKVSDWTDNPRQSMSEGGLEDLTASVRRHGVLQPILVRALSGKTLAGRYLCIAGARRLAAAKAAGLAEIPARVLALDEEAAEEVAIIENLQREDMAPLDEGRSYQRLLDTGRHIDDVAAAVGKSKPYVYQRLSLLRLIPRAQWLVQHDILPLPYALKLATLAADKQPAALDQCFRPLYRQLDDSGEALPSRDWLEPIGLLQAWIDKHAKLEPQSQDVAVLLPELAAQLEAATATPDGGQAPSVLALSSLHFHTDKSEPRPILVNSWKRAEGTKACKRAQPGVIVLGDGRGTLLQVCVAKKACKKHWPQAKKAPRVARGEAAPDPYEARWKRDQEIADHWRTARKPAALALLAQQLAGAVWSPVLVELLLEDLGHVDEVATHVGPVSTLTPAQWPQALALAWLAGAAYSESELLANGKRMGLTLTAKDITAAVPPPATGDPAPKKKGSK